MAPSVETPLLSVQGLTKRYGARIGCADIGFDLFPGEVLGIVGESGSGKSTLLSCLAGHLAPDEGQVIFDTASGPRDTVTMPEAERRRMARTDWAYVHQNPRDGLRMGVSAGGNVGERLMAIGARHYGDIRATAVDWLGRVEIAADRIDDRPRAFSGGMQQRLQIARNLVTGPRLVFMDEPTGGLDVSVQARLLDLLAEAAGPSTHVIPSIGPDYGKMIEQAALLQVGEQSGDGFVSGGATGGEQVLDVEMMIPSARADLDVAHAGLGELAGKETLAAKVVGRRVADAVELQGVGGFATEIEQ